MKRSKKSTFNAKAYYLLGSLATALFLVLAFLIKMGHTQSPLGFDKPIQTFAYHLQSSQILISFFSNFTNLFGDKGGFITSAVVALALFFIVKEKIGALWFGILVVISTGVNTLIKDLIGRTRPDLHRIAAFAHEGGLSFASGHSTFGVVLFGALFLIFFQKMRSSGSKFSFAFLAFFLALLVMFSRIFVGVHYPSDTIGGLLEGFAFLMFSYPTFVKFNHKDYAWKILK